MLKKNTWAISQTSTTTDYRYSICPYPININLILLNIIFYRLIKIMRLKILSESFITNGLDISSSNKCLLCSKVLEKHKDVIIDNPEGCIFKLEFFHPQLEYSITEYVNCIEFTAPVDTIILPNSIFETFFIDFHSEYYLDIEVFIPPQATKVIFRIEDRDIFNITDIKEFLENKIDKVYKFLREGQTITIDSHKLFIKELEPYSICLVNNTDLEVEFDAPEIKPPTPPPEIKKETIVNNLDNICDRESNKPEIEKLSREELRARRLLFYSKGGN